MLSFGTVDLHVRLALLDRVKDVAEVAMRDDRPRRWRPRPRSRKTASFSSSRGGPANGSKAVIRLLSTTGQSADVAIVRPVLSPAPPPHRHALATNSAIARHPSSGRSTGPASEDYTNKYKGEHVELALFGGEYQEGTLTAYCSIEDVPHVELNGHILVPLQNVASLHCSSRCDAPEPHRPPRGLGELDRDDRPDDEDDEA